MHFAPWPVVLPLLGGAFLAAVGEKLKPPIANAIAFLVALASTVFCALLLHDVRHEPVVYWFGGWKPREGLALGIDFAIDSFGAGLATLSAALTCCAILFSHQGFEKPKATFQALLLVFLAGLCGFSLTGDLFDLFVFFELMGAAAYGLCGYKSREVGPLQGAINFAVTNTAGAFLTLLGIALVYAKTGALNLSQLARALGTNPEPLALAAFALVCTGFLVKAAIVPFHFWLADAHAAAPTAVCILFSGVMVEAGLYGVARVYGSLFSAPLSQVHERVRGILIVAGIATCLLGAALCFAQRHLKRLLAFSTISHSGVMLLGIAALEPGGLEGTALYVVGHGCIKAALFLCAGMLLHRLHSVDELQLHGRGRGLPALGLLMAFAGVLLAGAPLSALFVGESSVHDALEKHAIAKAALLISGVVTGAAVLRACGRIFLGWGPREQDAPGGGEPDEEPETEPGRIHWTMSLPAVALVAAALVSMALPREAAGRTAARMLDNHAWAVRVLDSGPAPLPPAPEQGPLPISHGVWTAVAAAALAALTLGRKRLPEMVRTLVRSIWHPIALALRRLHTGEVGDQVAWFTLGVALLGCAMLFLQ